MSWSQDYSVPNYIELLNKLTNKHPQELLEQELERQGLKVTKTEQILLTEGMYDDIYGTRVTLSDGRVFVPKLVESYTERGNYGRDTYAWVLETETPTVDYVNGDDVAEEVVDEQEYYGGCDNDGCGCGF